jgi:16S rRNA C967 or C1407 C5-methylase (RsmB/RsmF family)
MTSDLLSNKGDLELFPQRHGMDGAFAARLRRIA